MKVQAMYYRDGRRLTDKTREVIARVFELDELEVQTRMLLGQDAYLNGRFEEAIKEWKLLVDARIAPEKENALLNAIANAERRIVRKD
jgi:cytochrome c-type biogenesis protein CcmH/NrfG